MCSFSLWYSPVGGDVTSREPSAVHSLLCTCGSNRASSASAPATMSPVTIPARMEP